MLDLISLPPGISAATAVLISLAAAVTSFISAVAGVGGGTILLGLMSTLLPATALIPVHGVVQLGSNFFRSILLLQKAKFSILAPFVLGSAMGSATSGVVFSGLPGWLIQYGIAGFIVYSVFGKVPSLGRGHIVIAGYISGFLTMLFGATGPFVGAFIKTFKLAPASHIATQAMMMTLQHLLKIIAFGALGFSFGPYLPLILMMLVCGFFGTFIGRAILFKLDPVLFLKIVNGVLLLLATRLLWMATESALS